MNIVTGYDMQYTLQQRLAPEAPDESTVYSPMGSTVGHTQQLSWATCCVFLRNEKFNSYELNPFFTLFKSSLMFVTRKSSSVPLCF